MAYTLTSADLEVGDLAIGAPIINGRMLAYPIPSTAITRLKRRARWVESGVETDMRVSEFGSYWRVHRRSIEDSRVFTGRPFGLERYYIPSDAWKRLLTVQPTPTMPWRSPVGPMLQALTSEPERIKVSGVRDHKVFSKTLMRTAYYVPSDAYLRIYERYAVLDPSVRSLRRPPVQFMGVGRFGFPAFTAWVDVTIGNVLNQRAAGYGFYSPRSKFWIPHDPRPLQRVREAIVASKTLRDKILLRIGPRPRFVAAGRPVLAGVDTVIVGKP